MKPNEPRNPWQRLVSAARPVGDSRPDSAPYGFATRVAALAFASEHRASLLDRFALRALGIACLLALASAVVNFTYRPAAKASSGPVQVEEQANADDPMAVLLDA